MAQYQNQNPVLVAVDCIIFGYDGDHLKLLVIKRAIEPIKDQWSLMGGFIGKDEDLDGAAKRILLQLTGLHDVYLEQFHAYGRPDRDPVERTISVVYFALIDIKKYSTQINDQYHAEWFKIKEVPELIFDHDKMVSAAMDKIRHQAALNPLLFELLPEKFTIPQLQNLYEQVYDAPIDNRNFVRKINGSSMLIKHAEKDKSGSRRGAFYYSVDKQKHNAQFKSFLTLISNSELSATQ